MNPNELIIKNACDVQPGDRSPDFQGYPLVEFTRRERLTPAVGADVRLHFIDARGRTGFSTMKALASVAVLEGSPEARE